MNTDELSVNSRATNEPISSSGQKKPWNTSGQRSAQRSSV